MQDDCKKVKTAEFLAVHYPHVDPALLRGLNEEIGDLKRKNGGNANIFLALRDGIAEWLESTQRTVFRKPNR